MAAGMGDGRNLTGHIAGHYLSAVSLMYAATGDIRFKQRADYIVKEREGSSRTSMAMVMPGLSKGAERSLRRWPRETFARVRLI
jgi:hypothetical protein